VNKHSSRPVHAWLQAHLPASALEVEDHAKMHADLAHALLELADKTMTGRRTTTQRGYGAQHQRLRRIWAPRVAGGQVPCARCGMLIAAGELWDLGHDDHNRDRYTGPEHARCNRATRSLHRRADPRPNPCTKW
jgi:hypothetical protein